MFGFRRFFNGINITPKTNSTANELGDFDVSSTTSKSYFHNGSSSSPLVTEAHSATLTNKSIDADTNTITNIDNADIKAAAAIARNKLASGSANHVLTNDGSGVMSSEAQLQVSRGGTGAGTLTGYVKGNGTSPFTASATIPRADIAAGSVDQVVINNGSGLLSSEAALSPTRGGTGVSNNAAATLTRSGNHALTVTTSNTTNITLPTTGTLASLAGTETFTNKTFDDPLNMQEEITPANPAVGYNKLYFKSDDNLYTLDSDGNEAVLTTSSPNVQEEVQNFIINGNFDFWQRGTSVPNVNSTTITSRLFVTDRFNYVAENSTVAEVTIEQSSSVPTFAQSGFNSIFSYEVDVTTATPGAPNANEGTMVVYNMEGYDFANVANRTCSLNFWVLATKTGTYCVNFTTASGVETYVAEYVVNSSNTWEEKTIPIVFDGDNIFATYTQTRDLSVNWVLMSGSNYTISANSWQPQGLFNPWATSNQVNALDNIANFFRLSQVQLILGSSTRPFERAGKTIEQEIALCQRYYEKSYDITVNPGTITNVGAETDLSQTSGSAAHINVRYKTRKSSPPDIVVIYNPVTGASGSLRNITAGSDSGATIAAGFVGETGFTVTGGSGTTTQDLTAGHWTSDSEPT